MTGRHPRLVGLVACLALAGLLVGLPVVLLGLGWGTLPTNPQRWWEWLLRPDDGRFVLLIVKAAAWVVWALLAWSLLAELVATLRGLPAPKLPGLAWSQAPARRLVAAAALLFVALPSTTATLVAAAPPAAAAPHHPTVDTPPPTATIKAPTPGSAAVTSAVVTPAAPVVVAFAAAPEPGTHLVRPGDSLWSIAETYLGSGKRFQEIADLNRDLLAGRPTFLSPGWVLTLPADAVVPVSHTVVPGDTLSGIARTHLGDETRWPALFQASRHAPQPDGHRLTDPDLIQPGWTITVPGTTGTTGASVPATSPSAPTAAAVAPASAPAVPATPAVQTPPVATSAAVPTPVVEAPVVEAPVAEAAAVSPAPWLVAGLVGAGAVLGGGLYRWLRWRRQAQFRARRPGRTIAAVPAELVGVEKTIISAGAHAAPTVTAVRAALRLLGYSTPAPPALLAVQLLPGEVRVRLAAPASLPAPWTATEAPEDGTGWALVLDGTLPEVGIRDPYPLLVSVGADDAGASWLVNLEQFGTVVVTGAPEATTDFVRYIAAEIAVNPWAEDVAVDCVGVAGELVGLDPVRLRHHAPGQRLAAVAAVHADAAAMTDRCTTHQVTAITGRLHDLGDELWPSRLLLVAAAPPGDPDLAAVTALVAAEPDRSATAVVLVDAGEPAAGRDGGGLALHLTADGRVTVPPLGVTLAAVRLTATEATGCTLLLTQADDLTDAPIPTDGDDGWRAHCDATGALREDLVLPRDTDPADLPGPVETVLPGPDAALIAASPVTATDLADLAPLVPDPLRHRVETTDPTLDQDLAEWWSETTARPRLSVLGPIRLRAGKEAPLARRPYFAELVAFLALHPQGVATGQLVEAFGVEAPTLRKHLVALRAWLGTDPDAGTPFVPHASLSPAALERGTPLYQVVGVLTDLDLFRRLRARGQARGAAGLADLEQALALVSGEPFTGQREGGWAWLADGVRHDQLMVCGIVDVAHLVTLARLRAGDLPAARAATEIAMLAAPYEDTPHLDLAAITGREGDREAAERIIVDAVCNRSDDGQPPADLAPRTAELVRTRHQWLTRSDHVA